MTPPLVFHAHTELRGGDSPAQSLKATSEPRGWISPPIYAKCPLVRITPKICVVTGSRAEYGLLYWVMRALAGKDGFDLQIAVTGSHLSPAHGQTVSAIEEDGFPIDARVECLLSSDTGVGMAKAVGLGVIGFADAFSTLAPDVVMVLGDRFEILAASQAAYLARIPIVHIAGGDVTEGALDESIRHMITKMATLHFVTHEEAGLRVRQLGENPQRVFDVGHLGLESIRLLDPLTRVELEEWLGFSLCQQNLLVTFHPPTLDEVTPSAQFGELAGALSDLGPDVGIVFTQPNADPGGAALDEAIREFVAERENAILVGTLGQRRYLSLMREVDAVVGNSSSGILEAPSVGTPTVNIGDRQKGRPQAPSIINASPKREGIASALREAMDRGKSAVESPYGDGHAAKRILHHLESVLPTLETTRKKFFDIEVQDG